MPRRPKLPPIKPARIRKLSFRRGISIGWIDNRVKSPEFGFLAEMQKREKSSWDLYTFLCCSADSSGLCKYSIRKIAQALQKGYNAIINAKNVLEDMDLIATRPIPEERNLTLWQVLTLPVVEGTYKARVKKRSSQVDVEMMDQTAKMVVDMFYMMVGQDKISSAKQIQGIKSVKRLIDDGFNIDDIRNAISWTVKNVPNAYSFAIIEKTIGQASKAKKTTEKKKAVNRLTEEFHDGDNVRWKGKIGTIEGPVVRFKNGVTFTRDIASELERL